ncbi:MAG: di-trans,poly-cis-decaprenylcistransferase [Candidatus Pacebacteria bacterium CG_4_10_14_0_8_um_filter_43_12]|nr:MAG: di-trans,poly-cis-decaprenylcistransferase [Candidatus Pacebacteria bacterium CG_4_10_14_0_8_um_filter_43_12]
MAAKEQKLKHVAIICDGNRRWARAHKLEAVLGHRKAVDEVFEPLIDTAIEQGIEFLTFWVFSTENWKRDGQEVSALLALFRELLTRQIEQLHKKGIKLQIIGDLSKFDQDIQEKVKRGLELTEENKKITVVFALNYGGRDELVRAANKILQAGKSEVTAEEFEGYLDTAGTPDPDLIIRTGGEQRLSGFLPWQSVYAELVFPEFYFPEFTPKKFEALLAEFRHRNRRFGK